MATIKPFRALRFNTELSGNLKDLISPPYDIINDEKYKQYINSSKYNIIQLELPKGEDPYNSAKQLLNKWIEDGILKRDNEDSIYIYEDEFSIDGELKKIKGFISLVKLEEFSKKIVFPHEDTLSKAKEDRLNLMKATSCNFSQVYSLYTDEQNKIANIIDSASSIKPNVEITDSDGIIHRLWAITDKNIINKISEQFKDKKLYIADGHHRYETAINYRDYCRKNGLSKEGDPVDYIMMMLVSISNSGVVIFPTHRLIRNLNQFDCKKIISQCKNYFEIEEKNDIKTIEQDLNALYKQSKSAFAFYAGNNVWTLMTLKDSINIKEILPELPASILKLDVTILHSLILERVFGIDKENMKSQRNLTYTRDIKEAINSVDCGNSQCAFILNPTRVSEIKDVAINGEKMPQKSTYFYPKIITGLVMNQIDFN